jgi:ZIP family zinc transporter
MLGAGFWGLVGGMSLLLGAAVGYRASIPGRVLGLIMGFGAGVLISALAFELTRESFSRGGRTSVAIGLAAGGLAFYVGDRIIDRLGGEHRKRSGGQMAGGSATALTLGALLDGIPESVAIGVTLLEGKGVGLAFVAAVFLSNVPESLSAATGMRKAGHRARYVLGVWGAVVVVSAVAAALGFALLGGVSDSVIATIQAFAAGAILVMLADTMMPEAFEEGGSAVGLVTLLGFTLAFILSTLE